ncbi:cytochrome P450 [Nemania sp. NC0429]|nr:cytochrome P450 [Nemania sp. NC0429]
MDLISGLYKPDHLFSWGALSLVVALFAFYRVFFGDPLSKVPGPWYARWIDLIDKYHWMTGDKPIYIHDLHLKYGPVVRTAPREVYIADSDSVQKVFRIKNEFPKAQWYRDFVPSVDSIFNTTDTTLHRHYRRLLSAPLSESGLKSYLPQVETKVNLVIKRMEEEFKTRGTTDIFKWWLFMATDVIGELSFGESFRMLESGKINQYVIDLQSAGRMGAYRSAFPSIFKYSARYKIPLPGFKTAISMASRIQRYAEESIQRHKDITDAGAADAIPTVFSKVYKAQGEDSITLQEVQDNAQTYIVAGSDTTSNTLTFLVWSVCRDPKIKSRLLKELEMLPNDFTLEDVRQLSYLDHVIDETLRRFPSAPSGMPRRVPEGGAVIGGYRIPGGYTVTTQNYSLHRDPHAFPEPEKFDPSRWENPTQEMKDLFMPFGGGSRICIGLHLAKIEIRLAVAKFFRTFPNAKVSTLEGMSDEDMIPQMFFLINPKGHRCLIDLQ